jgi:transcriptional regulator with XRE-family HTH domain
MSAVDPTPGEWLNQQLDRRDIDVRDVADRLRVTTQAVYRWLRDTGKPSEANVTMLAEMLALPETTVRKQFDYWVEKPAKKQPARVDDEARARRLRKLHKDAQALAEAIAKELDN